MTTQQSQNTRNFRKRALKDTNGDLITKHL